MSVVAGIGCDLALYGRGFCLWGDECALILNVRQKSGAALYFGRLDEAGAYHTQAVPPLFLMAMKALAGRFGSSSEYAMRLVPLVAGIIALPLFATIAWRLFGAAVAAWIVPVLTFAGKVTEHAAAAKPYSSDLLCSLLLLAAAMQWRSESAASRLARTAVLAAAGFWFSYPSIFVFAALSLMLLPRMWRDGWRTRCACVAANLLALASLAPLYALTIRRQHDQFLQTFWADCFPNLTHPLSVLPWLLHKLWELYTYIQTPTGGVLMLVAVVGMVGLWRERRRELLWALAGPIALAVVAAVLRMYPFGPKRVSLFLAPFALLLAAAGLEQLRRQTSPRHVRQWWWVPAALAVMAGLYTEAKLLLIPKPQSYIRSAVAYLRANRHAGEPIYVAEGATLEFRVYWPNPDPLIHLNCDFRAPIRHAQFWVMRAFDEHDPPPQRLMLPGADIVVLDQASIFRTPASIVARCRPAATPAQPRAAP